jgi:CRISPR-associated exonuclease Cas4
MSTNTTKKQSFEEFAIANFLKTINQESKESLGDRSKYIGASDVGGCPFKAIKEKLEKPEYSIEKQIVFQRGHIAEELVAKMINGVSCERQVEVKGEIDNFPLIAHLDFLIRGKTRSVIIEAKTVSSSIDEPYESWILQVQFQMGLLMNEIQNEDHLLEAYIVAIDINKGWYKIFKIDFNDDLFLMALNKATHLVDCLQNGAKPHAVIQNYCSSCPFVQECPKQGCFASELPDDLKIDLKAIKQHKIQDKAIKQKEEKVKEYLINTGLEKAKIDDEDLSVVISCKESVSNRFDTTAFKKDYPELAVQYSKESSSFRMTIN